MSEEEAEEKINFDEFEEEVNNRLDNYFSQNKNILLSYSDLESFLKAIELYEYWNTEDDKDTIWQSLIKYGKDDKVDSDGIKKGMHDFINFLKKGDEEIESNENDSYLLNNIDNNDKKRERKESKDENLLTRMSRISFKNEGNSVNKLVLNKYKQKAIEEYDCLDNDTLIQLKRIFLLLNISENNKNIIPIERIGQLINKHKFITLEKNEIIRYIHYLSCDDKPIDEITSININNNIFTEIDSLIKDKLINEGLDIDQLGEEEEEEEIKDNEEDPLDILDEILKNVEDTKENSLLLKNLQNNLIKSNQNFAEKISKNLLENFNENQNEIINNIQGMGIGNITEMEKFDKFLSTLTKDQKINIKKIHSLRKNILSLNNEISKLKDDYNFIYEKYNNNQAMDLDEEMQRLCDENMTLDQELKSKKEEISELINEKAQKDKEINDLYIKIDNYENIEKDFKNQVNELKLNVEKIKNEYNTLIDTTVHKMEKKEKEEKKERERMKELITKQLKNEEENNLNNSQNEKLDIKALNEIDMMNISLTDKLIKKKKILSQLNFEQLMEYTLKLERLNINLKSEKEKKEQKIKELEEKLNQSNKTLTSNKKEIGELNIEIKKLSNIISNLRNEVKTSEIFRPSNAMNSQARLSRISKLNMEGLNSMKFKQFQIDNKNNNSNDFFKIMVLV